MESPVTLCIFVLIGDHFFVVMTNVEHVYATMLPVFAEFCLFTPVLFMFCFDSVEVMQLACV